MNLDSSSGPHHLRTLMAECGADALVLAPTDNLLYARGLSPFPDERACVFFLTEDREALVVPSINVEDLRRDAEDVQLFEWDDGAGPDNALLAAISHLELAGSVRIAVDPEMRADVMLRIQTLLPEARYLDGAIVLRPAREVKSTREVSLLQESARTADAAMRRALSACRAGVAEVDVAEAAVAGFRAEGVTHVSFTIVGGGPNGSYPHHHTGDRVLAEGDPVVIDIGGKREHYSSDITRMAHLGEPSARYREVHGIVDAAVMAALAAIRPGVACGDIDAAARSTIVDAGFGEYFVHRTGHGLGLSMHEPPWIVAGSEAVVSEGMVFSVEPGVYLPGEFGVRLEEIVHVTADGCAILSSLPRDVHVVDDD